MASACTPRRSLGLFQRSGRPRLIYQIVVAVLIGFIVWIVSNTPVNLAEQTTGFDFLWKTAGFDISFTLFPWTGRSDYWEAFLVGLTNTILVAVLGIILSDPHRLHDRHRAPLSQLSHLAAGHGLRRDHPQHPAAASALLLVLRGSQEYAGSGAACALTTFFINKRGIFVPEPQRARRLLWAWVVVAHVPLGIAPGQSVASSDRQRFPVSSHRAAHPAAPDVVVASGTITFDPPCSTASTSGGMDLPPEFVALFVGLSIYTAAFIAETVRGGILAISHGQTEAAQALGLKEGDRLRLVIVPQAMRVIIPR